MIKSIKLSEEINQTLDWVLYKYNSSRGTKFIKRHINPRGTHYEIMVFYSLNV